MQLDQQKVEKIISDLLILSDIVEAIKEHGTDRLSDKYHLSTGEYHKKANVFYDLSKEFKKFRFDFFKMLATDDDDSYSLFVFFKGFLPIFKKMQALRFEEEIAGEAIFEEPYFDELEGCSLEFFVTLAELL